jgi:hypothetical protein
MVVIFQHGDLSSFEFCPVPNAQLLFVLFFTELVSQRSIRRLPKFGLGAVMNRQSVTMHVELQFWPNN